MREISLTAADIRAALKAFIVETTGLEADNVVAAWNKGVPPPAEGFAVMTPVAVNAHAVSETDYPGGGIKRVKGHQTHIWRVDFYGERAPEQAGIFFTLFAGGFKGSGLTPLYAEDITAGAAPDGGRQYAPCHTVQVHLACYPVVRLPQTYMNNARIKAVNADTAGPQGV